MVAKRLGKKKTAMLVAVLVLVVSAALGFMVVRILSHNRERELFEQQFSELEISTEPISDQERDEYTVPPERPRYLYIPAAGVGKTRLIALGVKSPGDDGNQQLDVPKNINDVGWYDCQINPLVDRRCAQTTLPGSGHYGVATLLTGHTCFSRTMRCVFDNLSKLERGDAITIERGDGEKLEYTVRSVEIVKLADVDMKKAVRSIELDKEGLTLITCAGKYRGTVDANGVPTADKRVLVYATRNE